MHTNNTYYVYAWYFKSTGKVFHIGKGTKNRYLETKISRNAYFKNIIQKYSDDVEVKKLYENLTDEEACDLERKLIKEYKARGECETNFHEGGHGGNTGNYDNPERSRKISEAIKSRIGEKNSNFGKRWSPEDKAKLSQKLKQLWEDPEQRKRYLENRHYEDFVPWNKGKLGLQIAWNKGQQLSEDHYIKMMNIDCKYKYEVYLNDQKIYWCLGRTKLLNFMKEEFNLSRTIVEQLISGTWIPKFNKHLKLKTLQIKKVLRDPEDFVTVVEERLINEI